LKIKTKEAEVLGFKPFELTLVIESQKEVDALRELFGNVRVGKQLVLAGQVCKLLGDKGAKYDWEGGLITSSNRSEGINLREK